VNCAIYSSGTAQYALTGSSDRTIILHNPSTLSSIQKYAAHGYEVLDVAVSEDNARFVSGGGDRSVFLWDVSEAKTIRRFGGNGGHTGRIEAVAWGGEGDSVMVSGE
jgi:mitogen-activated protein kinase organizer 1